MSHLERIASCEVVTTYLIQGPGTGSNPVLSQATHVQTYQIGFGFGFSGGRGTGEEGLDVSRLPASSGCVLKTLTFHQLLSHGDIS